MAAGYLLELTYIDNSNWLQRSPIMIVSLCCVAFVGVCGEHIVILIAWLLIICLSWHRQLQLATPILVIISHQSVLVHAVCMTSSFCIKH